MKKIILLLVLGVGLLPVIFINAAKLQYSFTDYYFADAEAEEREVSVVKGWNLVHGFANPTWITGGDIESKDIKAIFIFDSISKKYLRMYPNPVREDIDNLRSVPEMVLLVYSKKSGTLKFKTQKSDTLRYTWPAGSNMVGITDIFIGKSINQLKGSCVINDYYIWQPKKKTWSKEGLSLDTPFSAELVGKGILFKFDKECALKKS